MSYVMGFVAAVPEANKEAYRKHAEAAFPIFKDTGVTRMVECWEDDVADGELTDLRKAVKAEPGEKVVFSWMEYPTKELADAADEKMQKDPRMEAFGSSMPFDGKRMIYGGFDVVSDVGTKASAAYIDGVVIAAPGDGKPDYASFAKHMSAIMQEYGAERLVDSWGADVPAGETTDFARAVKLQEGETVAFGWIEWPSKAARDEGWGKSMADERMSSSDMPFDGKRMIFGGFTPLVDMS